MSRSWKISLEPLREELMDYAKQIATEYEEEINKQYEDARAIVKQHEAMGKVPVIVGYEDKFFYVGIFCSKDRISKEQVERLETLNKEIIRNLDYIFKKSDALSYNYNAMKKSLPVLDKVDKENIEEIRREITNKSTSKYLLQSKLTECLKQLYPMKKLIDQTISRPEMNELSSIDLYDFDAIKDKYREIHLAYRCCKAIDEWQEEELSTYLGWANPNKVELLTEEQYECIRKKLRSFEISAKKVCTSELVDLVTKVAVGGEFNEAVLKEIEKRIH